MKKIDDMSLDELSQVLIECQKALAELKESKKEGKWKPKIDEEYYYRDSYGDNVCTYWYNDDANHWRINNIPIFPTEEECERYWHFMDTVKEKSYEFSHEDFKNSDIYKFSIGYIPETDNFIITHCNDCVYFGKIHFKTEEDAQYIIDNFKDELMEFFL